MVTFVYRITDAGKNIHLTGGGDVTHGNEFEVRLAGCLDTAIRAAMTEVLQHVKEKRIIETKMIQETAEAAIREFAREHPLE
jgi:hypothetical protein